MTIRERAVLQIEARTWDRRRIGRKDTAIRELCGMSPERHAVIVNMLIDRVDVIAEEPVLCARLRRLREQRAAARC